MGNSRDFNRVYGTDANVRLFGMLDWSSYLVRTETPGRTAGQYAARTSMKWEGKFFHGKGVLMSIGEGFSDDLGFYRRVGVKKWALDMGIRPRPISLERFRVRELHPHITWDYFTDQGNQPVAKRLHNAVSMFFNDGSFYELSHNPVYQRIASPFRINPGVAPIPAGGYAWHEYRLRASTDPSRAVALSLTGVAGGLWDGTQRTINSNVVIRPDHRFRLSLGHQRTSARLDSPSANFVATLYTARSGYAFSTTRFLDALTQFEPRSRQMNANVRFNIIHHPLSDLFIVYNDQRVLTADGPIPGRSLAIKVTQTTGF